MNSSSQPTVNFPRYHKLTVKEVKEALKDMPDDALIKCGNGCLEAREHAPYLEVKLQPANDMGAADVVLTHWT